MDVVIAGAVQFNSEEKAHLEATAKFSRSHMILEKSLKEKCLESIFASATRLYGASATRQQFTLIPPLLRREYLKKLETWVETNKSLLSYQLRPSTSFEQTASLVRLLLDKSITAFDFQVYGSRHVMDHETWQLLFEKCPDLIRVEDSRERTKADAFELKEVLPGLLKLTKLEHINLKYYQCSGAEVLQLLEAFPNLRSLGTNFKYQDIGRNLLYKLSKLMDLEYLWIGLSGLSGENERIVAEYLRDELLFECILYLPLLQEVAVVDLNNGECADYTKIGLLRRPVALRSLSLAEDLQGWTCDMLPCVTKLELFGPLRDANQFLGFTKLTALHIFGVSGHDLMKILRSCPSRLQELKMKRIDYHHHDFDPYELFFLCPNLRTLCVDEYECLHEGNNPELYPVRTKNFRYLKNVSLQSYENFPQSILMEIIMAPQLETVSLLELILDQANLEILLGRLQRKEILQNLTEFCVYLYGVEEAVREHFVTFFKMLIAYAPRLEFVCCNLNCDGDAEDLEIPEFLTKLEIPGLRFKIDY